MTGFGPYQAAEYYEKLDICDENDVVVERGFDRHRNIEISKTT